MKKRSTYKKPQVKTVGDLQTLTGTSVLDLIKIGNS